MNSDAEFVTLKDRHLVVDPIAASRELLRIMSSRRSIRSFSDRPIEKETLENVVRIASSAPSGANRQPWYFAIVQNQETKEKIRAAAEKVEFDFYTEKATTTWLEDLKPFGTNHLKPYLSVASALIVVFSRTSVEAENSGAALRTYYPIESTGIATGFLISALHQAGLATLTHTPKPMFFMNEVLNLDKTFRPYMIVVAGYPNEPVEVPDIRRKAFHEVAGHY